MKISVIEKIKRLPKQTEESLNDAFTVLLSVEDRKSVDDYIKWIRAEARKIRSAEMYELFVHGDEPVRRCADSLAMMAGYIAERPKVISVARRPF